MGEETSLIAVGREEAEDLGIVVRVSLVDVVAGRIRDAIFSGSLLPGQKLIVRELSDTLGVSHTPIKDALNRLVAEGLVEALPHRSMRVRQFSNHELVESMAVRLMTEVFFAAEIIRGAALDRSVVTEMAAAVQKMENAISGSDEVDYQKWVEAETCFHRRYVAASENPTLISLYNNLDSNRMTYFAFLANTRAPLKKATLQQNNAEHRAILSAIAAADVAAFRRAVSHHILRACEDYSFDADAALRIEQVRRLVETNPG